MSEPLAARLYARISSIPGAAGEARAVTTNRWIHIATQSAVKLADGLINPKLVLAWLLHSLGAGGLVIGLLVPVREAGSLLPQLALTRWLERHLTRRHFWSAGSAVQGLAAAGIAVSALTLDGPEAGWAVLACLAVLSVARAACSISQKDALARTIAKGGRGAITGASGSLGSALVLAFALLLATGTVPLTVASLAAAIAVAGGLWLAAAALFLALREEEHQPVRRARGLASLFGPLRQDPMLCRFIAARALLTGTALAPPFIVMLAGSGSGDSGGLGTLGPLMLASAAASIASEYVWGRLSDRSSRKALIAAALIAAAVLGAAAAMGLATGGLGGLAGASAAVFAAQVAYAGVRIGRKTHLTDMAGHDTRAHYTALSNTVIGGVLLLGGGAGLVAEYAGPAWTLALLAVLCLAAVPVAYGMEEVQAAPDRRTNRPE